MSTDYILSLVRDVPDFPKPGIVFKDITPIFQDPRGLKETMALFEQRLRDKAIDLIIGVESRGFLFGAPVAIELGLGLGLVRKKGKLPYATIERSYELEYGTATLEAHTDMVTPGQRVVILDDLLATGGTALATAQLCRELGANVVEAGFLIELGFLPGRAKLEAEGIDVFAPICF
ncbi:MAG: adenine phosphoribosyltransferase [Proteobacteria bacterium]|nr:adenine phosphoribosyltransferase [Pseudomonadota bacterium]